LTPEDNTGRPLVVATSPGFGPDDVGTRVLRAGGCTVVGATVRRKVEEVRDMVSDADAVVVSTDPFDGSVFQAAPRLRVIARTGVGTDAIDLAAATRAGVPVTTARGANEETVADHTLALMLAAARRVPQNDAAVRLGEWKRGPLDYGCDLHGKTVGLVGLGMIGQAVAQRLRGFQVRLIACRLSAVAPEGIALVTLDELLQLSDFISLSLPLTEKTVGFIGPREFSLMKPGAVLVNTSRGGLVDEASLVTALKSGKLRAAALDVFQNEPPKSSPLLELTNVVLSPHIAALSPESVAALAQRAANNVLSILGGVVTQDVVNPDAFAHPRWAGKIKPAVMSQENWFPAQP